MERWLVRISEMAARRRWAFIVVWGLLFLAAGPFAGKVADELSNGGFEVPGSQSVNVIDELDRQPGSGAQAFGVLVRAESPAAAESRLAAATATVSAQFPEIRFRNGSQASEDGRTLVSFGEAAVTQNESLKLAKRVKEAIEQPTGDTRTYVLGQGAIYDTVQEISQEDIAKAESITFPVIAVVLIVLFGALVAAALPLILGLASVTIAFAVVYFVARETEISIYAQSIASMIGIGVAVDYSLFVLARFREELAAGADRRAAVATAMARSGTAVVFSGLTVIVSLGTIFLVPVRAVQSMAAAAMIVVAVAVLAAATLLPALLHLLGHRVNRGGSRLFGRLARRPAAASPFWHGFATRVMARPVVSFLGAAGVLLLLAAPALDLRTATTSLDQLPTDEPVVVGSNLLSDEVTGDGRGREGQLTVIAKPTSGAVASIRPQVDALAAELRADRRLQGVQVQPLQGALAIAAPLAIDPETREANDRLVPAVRELVAQSALADVATVDVGGLSAFGRDLNEEVGGDMWKVIAAALVLAYLLLMVMLRSVLLPLKAVIMNLLSIGAAYGVLVAVFQWGWLDWTGFDSLGYIGTLTPPLVLAITFGLSMDYEVFLLARIRERWALHGDNTRAVAEGLESSARIITSAAVIMVAVFGAFVLTGVPAVKEVGLGLAVAIAIDATITRLILVPATMKLLGDWNWWLPSWLDRILPQGVRESAEPVAAR